MIAVINKMQLSHPFFNHIPDADKDEMLCDIQARRSMLVSFEDHHGKPVFAAVVDILNDRVHAREVVGNFPKNIVYLDKFCAWACSYFGIEKISFCARRKGVERIGEKIGYIRESQNEFSRAV